MTAIVTPPKTIPAYAERFGLGRLEEKDDPRDWKMVDAPAPKTPLGHALAGLPPPIPLQRTWKLRKVLDQGVQPRCVGYSFATKLRCEPFYDPTPDPDTAYFGAQDNDEWPGRDYAGSSVPGVLKWALGTGDIKDYWRAQNVDDISDWVRGRSPVLIGIPWYASMFSTDSKGLIHVSGYNAGGHAIAAIGADEKRELFTLANTWGRDWGAWHWSHLFRTGRGFMRYSDMDRLVFRENGEAFGATKAWAGRGH